MKNRARKRAGLWKNFASSQALPERSFVSIRFREDDERNGKFE